jgi:hypothetical protein
MFYILKQVFDVIFDGVIGLKNLGLQLLHQF